MRPEDEALLRDAHAAFGITWGTDQPYALSDVRFEKIGFAHIPAVVVTVHCKDVRAMTPTVRQYVFHELETAGVSNQAVKFTPTVGMEKERQKYVDLNDRSATKGQNKVGGRYRVWFEIVAPYDKTHFEWEWAGHGSIKQVRA